MLQYERQAWLQGWGRLAGVDEAGRGPLAGPVVAAAVVFDPAFVEREYQGVLRGLTDSKKLSPARREAFFAVLRHSPDVQVGVGMADIEEIDRLNILHATHLAMSRAIRNLPELPQGALVDGLPVPGLPCPSKAIVGGDGKSLSIAAASVIAKVERDRIMVMLDARYPDYGFASHKGYGSCGHIRALFEYGPTPVHRRSFRPVQEAIELRRRAALPSSA